MHPGNNNSDLTHTQKEKKLTELKLSSKNNRYLIQNGLIINRQLYLQVTNRSLSSKIISLNLQKRPSMRGESIILKIA